MDLNIPIKSRDITVEDLEELGKIRLGSKPSLVKKMRDTHHALARLLAEGRKNEEISKITGYSPSYISNIKNDPAFQSLVDYYKGQVAETFISVHERLAALSMLSAEELQERLSENPEEFSHDELMDLLKLSADRTGFGPQSRNLNVNVNVGFAERLREARERAGLSTPDQSTSHGPESSPQLLDLRAVPNE